jgi:hypothetical protein
MSISRWQFVCKNDGCKYKNYGFVFLSPWPLGRIADVINSKKVSDDIGLKEKLEERKKLGIKYACIQYPDPDKISVEGYRINLWCNKCLQLSEFDVLMTDLDKEKMTQEHYCVNDGQMIQNAIKNSNVPEECPTCKSKFRTYSSIIDYRQGGLLCPSCKIEMPTPSVLFANEE